MFVSVAGKLLCSDLYSAWLVMQNFLQTWHCKK